MSIQPVGHSPISTHPITASGEKAKLSLNHSSSLHSLEPSKNTLWNRVVNGLAIFWKCLCHYTFLGRFFPCKKIEGKISIASRSTGLLGRDGQYSFGKTIQLKNGNFLQVNPQDFTCLVNITIKEKTICTNLPSSLFQQAREGNQIFYTRDGKNYCLELSPCINPDGMEVSFDACLKELESDFKVDSIEFLYTNDVPEDYFHWTPGIFPIFLSPQTKRIEVGKQGVKTLAFEELKNFGCYSRSIAVFAYSYTENNIHYELVVCGRPHIDLLIDRKYLYVYIWGSKLDESLELHDVNSEMFYNAFWKMVIQVDEKRINKELVSAFLNTTGILMIDIPLLSIPGLPELSSACYTAPY
jgi:hypothetical protein